MKPFVTLVFVLQVNICIYTWYMLSCLPVTFSHKDIYLYGAVWDYSSPTLARANQHCTICKTNVG